MGVSYNKGGSCINTFLLSSPHDATPSGVGYFVTLEISQWSKQNGWQSVLQVHQQSCQDMRIFPKVFCAQVVQIETSRDTKNSTVQPLSIT